MQVTVDRQEKEVRRGLVSADELYDLAGRGEERLFLHLADDEKIPLLPADHVIIRGGEIFATGGAETQDDPPLGKADGAPLAVIAFEKHFQRRWQRWSCHYQSTLGKDNLASHVEYVFNELRAGAPQ